MGAAAGIKISKKAGMVPLQMELGGKDVCLVCADADLDLAAKSIVKGGLSYSGQRCTAVKVVLALESIADALISKVTALVAKLTVGKAAQDADICAVISESSAKWIEELFIGAHSSPGESRVIVGLHACPCMHAQRLCAMAAVNRVSDDVFHGLVTAFRYKKLLSGNQRKLTGMMLRQLSAQSGLGVLSQDKGRILPQPAALPTFCSKSRRAPHGGTCACLLTYSY